MKKATKIIALLLALLMLAGLCACDRGSGNKGGSASGGSSKMPQKVKLEHVYTAQYIDSGLPSGSTYSSIDFVGDKVYVTVPYTKNTNVDGENVTENGTELYVMNDDGSDAHVVATYTSTMDFNMEAGEMKMVNISNILPVADGTVWYYKTDTYANFSDENNYVNEDNSAIIHATLDGEELVNIPVSQLGGDYFMVGDMFVDDDGNITVTSGGSVMGLAPDGSVIYKVELEDSTLNNLVVTGNGDIVGINNSFNMDFNNMENFENTTTLVKLNKATGELEELGALPIPNAYSMIGGDDDTVLINSGASVYFYDINTKQLSEKLNWLNSDINYNRVGTIVPASDGRIIIVESTGAGGMFGGMGMGMGMGMGASGRMAMLTGKPDSEITEKYIITFAANQLSESVQDAVITFNKTHDEYRIQFKDYSIYNEEGEMGGLAGFAGSSSGVAQLNYDIIAGDIPDMFLMEGLPFETYASKGLLADLGPIMDADPTFNREDYLENVLEASSFKGKICSIIPGFSIMTLVGKESNVGAEPGWTMSDLNALMQKYPDAAAISDMTKPFMLMMFSMMGLENYIDSDSGTCSFNSQDFIDMLEFINTFPDEIDYSAMFEGGMGGGAGAGGGFGFNNNTRYRDNQTLLQMVYLSDYEAIKTQTYDFGEDVTFVGFPVASGVGSTIQPQLEIGISSKTALTDACWEFIKYLLSEDFQSGIVDSESFMAMNAYPIKKSVLDGMAQEAMTEKEEELPITGFSMSDMMSMMYSDEQREFMAKPLTQEQVDRVNAAITSATNVARDRDDVLAIIEEESGAFFSGQKTSQTVADIIQSRVNIYVNENR